MIPAYLAKGIEFDAVIIYNASPKMYTTMRAFVDCSILLVRAMHELQLYSVGEVSPLFLRLIRRVLNLLHLDNNQGVSFVQDLHL